MSSFSDAVIGQDFKERYNFTCPSCGNEHSAAPSIIMTMGMNSGHGSCPDCDTFLHLAIDDSNERMNATLWEDHTQKLANSAEPLL